VGAGLVLVLAGVFFVRAVRNPARVSDPPPPVGERANALATRIDPNVAGWEAWAALPGIGEKRAREIVAWREAYLAEHPGEVAFGKAEDLMKVKGIKKATVETLGPYLTFPEEAEEGK
jgi:DNA uptake protein ComE-like DNA-binding protein